MKKLALGIVIAAGLMSSPAMADQRPTYIAFKAPVAAQSASITAPAAPTVAKRDKSFGKLPLYVPLIGILGLAGLIAALSGGSNGSPG